MPLCTYIDAPLATSEANGLPVKYVSDVGQMIDEIDAATDATILNRDIPDAAQIWLNELPIRSLPTGRLVLNPKDVESGVRHLFKIKAHGASTAQTWLIQDIAQLAQHIEARLRPDFIRMRMESVDDNACSKLHSDNVVARMICTYRGPGTQRGLAETPLDTLHTVPTSMPVLLKGKRWQDVQQPKLLHRSPPIEGQGITRLVLVLEGISKADISAEYDMIYETNRD